MDGDQRDRTSIQSLGVEGRTRGTSAFSLALLKCSVTMAVVRPQISKSLMYGHTVLELSQKYDFSGWMDSAGPHVHTGVLAE